MVSQVENRIGARIPGRGAGSNDPGRFERHGRESVDDGWTVEPDLPPLRTEVSIEQPRRIITRNTSPDVGFDRSINPYRGCEHGCTYCFARPTHAWLGLSPGLDFETRLVARPDAAAALRRELSAKGYRPAPIAIGTNTDPYQPIEKRYRIMRDVLGVLSDFNHPVTVVTKGALIERDIDLLASLAARGLTRVGISVTTLDRDLSRRMEPRAPGPARRLATIRRLAAAGIEVRVMVAPVVPALTDHEMEAILSAAREAGAVAASWIMLRLPLEVSGLFRDWLSTHCPDRAERVLGRVRSLHGGKDYDPEWGRRMRGEGPFSEMMTQRFALAVRRLGLATEQPPLDCGRFAVPLATPDQPSLFD